MGQIEKLEQQLQTERQAREKAEAVLSQYRRVLLNTEQWDDLYPDLSPYDVLFKLKDQANEVLNETN